MVVAEIAAWAHRRDARSGGPVPPDVSPFAAVDSIDEESLSDLAALVGTSSACVLFRADMPTVLPPGWW